MTKDKYKLFGRKRAVVPSLNLDLPKVERVKPQAVVENILHKISKLEPPEDPRPEPIHPRINPEHHLPVRRELANIRVSAPPPAQPPPLASSTKEFFSAARPLASKPLLRIPEKKPQPQPEPEPVPGSRAAKLREFVKMFF